MPVPRTFLRRYWSSVVLGVTGVVFISAGLLQSPGRDLFAGELIGFGFVSMVLCAFASRLREVEVSATGVKGKLDEQHQVEESSWFLSGPEHLPAASEALEEDELVIGARTALAGDALAALLDPVDDSELAGCLLRLYLFDRDQQLLVPVLRGGDPDPGPMEVFRPGCGSTGTAWAKGEWVFVEGPAVADATYGLTVEQQEHFRNLTAIASCPIFNAVGKVLGVLTASTEAGDGPTRLAGEEAYYDVLSRSFGLARVLVDLLKWFDDEYDQER